MTTTLITGANKGLGYETARRLVEAGHTVYVGARDVRRGEEAAGRLGARFVQLDITDDESVQAAAGFVAKDAGRLDVLVNNAGIVGVRKPIGETSGADMRRTFETNVFGAVLVTRAFLPLLEAGTESVVVNVASGLGSLAATNDPDRIEYTVASLDYTSSKTALIMVNSQYAKAYPGIRFNAVDPGYTATDLNGNSGHNTVEEGADIIVRMALIGPDGPTGGFFDAEGVAAW
ncbi:SDR family NAD(P)-dependent oxidoreductase [Streptomyces sp. NPDC051784]|uniref:SDR family NAD(P)-dependent oxidoreductase n=1 Tax=Streptomyces sp. NPDC051784 TaxID=3155805 RepID=UPI00343A422B